MQKIVESKLNDLHTKAMDIAEEVEYRKRKDEFTEENIKKMQREAFELERQAALLMRDKYEEEPTRSVLFQSAGWLAYHAELYDEAAQMAHFGLTGNPPHPIGDELRSLLKDVEEAKRQREATQSKLSLETIIAELKSQPFHIQVQVYNYLQFISKQRLAS